MSRTFSMSTSTAEFGSAGSGGRLGGFRSLAGNCPGARTGPGGSGGQGAPGGIGPQGNQAGRKDIPEPGWNRGFGAVSVRFHHPNGGGK